MRSNPDTYDPIKLTKNLISKDNCKKSIKYLTQVKAEDFPDGNPKVSNVTIPEELPQ